MTASEEIPLLAVRGLRTRFAIEGGEFRAVDGVDFKLERGKNGPVSVGLVKTSENIWSVPAGAKLNDAQFAAFKAGEIRGQLMP